MASSSEKKLRMVVAAVLGIGLAGLLMYRTHKQRARTVSHGVFNAWYARTPAPVLIVEQWTRIGARQDPDNLRRSRDAEITIRYHSHRLDDGALLGSFSRKDWTVPPSGVWNDRVWVCGKGEPALLAADGLKVVSDREAIRQAIAGDVGGDFEVGGGKCYVDQYSGRLAINGADGKRYWVTTELRVEPRPTDAVHPPGYYCSLQKTELIEPNVVECMAEDGSAANVLVTSKASALAKDANKPLLLSGTATSYSAGTRVLWTKPLTELTGQPDPLWLGAHLVAPGRVALLVRTAQMRVHVIELDPADGAVRASKVLFDKSAPGT